MAITAYLLALVLIWTGAAVKTAAPPCDRRVFRSNVDNCLSHFNKSMETSGFEDGCPWPAVKSSYHRLKLCVDDWAVSSWCKGCGSLVDDVFSGVHRTYFSHCGYVRDPPVTVLMLLMLPCTIATLSVPFLCVRVSTPSDA